MGFFGVKTRRVAWATMMVLMSACNFVLKNGNDDLLRELSSSVNPYTQFLFSSINQTSGYNIGGCFVINPADGSRYTATVLGGGGVITIGSNTYTAVGNADIVLTKQSRSGAFLWSQFITGDGTEQTVTGAGQCMTITNGNVYLGFISVSSSLTVGAFSEARIGSVGANESYILGFRETDGSLQYHRHFGVAGGNSILVSVASRGNRIYWAGYSSDFSITGPGTGCAPYFCADYGAVDATNGSDLWARRWGNGYSGIYGIVGGSNGDVYLAGLYQGTGNDPGVGSPLDTSGVGTGKGFVERVSATDGTPVWVRSITGLGGSTAEVLGVQVDPDDNVYLPLLSYDTSLGFESGGTHTMSTAGGLMASYDSSGSFRWATDLPNASQVSQVLYDPKIDRITASVLGNSPTTEPLLFQLDRSGTITREFDATRVASGFAYALGVALDPLDSSLVVMGTMQDSVIIEGQTYTSNLPGTYQVVFFEWK